MLVSNRFWDHLLSFRCNLTRSVGKYWVDIGSKTGLQAQVRDGLKVGLLYGLPYGMGSVNR